MGLAQNFCFDSENSDELVSFIKSIFDEHSLTEYDGVWVVRSQKNDEWMIKIIPTDFGFYVHRSGDYFSVLGILVEAITGRFGQLSIDDV